MAGSAPLLFAGFDAGALPPPPSPSATGGASVGRSDVHARFSAPLSRLSRCRKGSLRCVDAVLRRMRRVRSRLGCDHRAVFATTYLELTRVLRRALRPERRFFRDRRWLIRADALFADFYFRALSRASQGRLVPRAWAIAFRTAASPDATALDDMLLGINAHVQRDLPYVLARVGLRGRRGSRKPDHDRVNRVLAMAYEPVVRAVGRRYDPLLNTLDGPVPKKLALDLLKGWRERAWRNAERLERARTTAERRRARQAIEEGAVVSANGLAASRSPGYGARRDAYCRRSGSG